MRALSRLFGTACVVCYLAGCSTPTAVQQEPAGTQVLDWWKPHLLYVLPAPHPRLYVEVDAVEGCVPKERTLQKLHDFLSTYCDKPDGIEIVRSDVIPVEAARGFSEKALARKYINGPGKNKGSPPAFMYVLFYNDALRGETPKAAQPGASMLFGHRAKPANPYTDVLFYPAVYFNTRYVGRLAINEALLHEAGHMLGLASRPVHTSGRHCESRTCLMNSTIVLHRWILGMQRRICRDCAAELAQSSTQAPPPNLRYAGEILVRSNPDYHIISLPNRVGVVVGTLSDGDLQDFRAAARPKTPDADQKSWVYCLAKDEILKEPARLTEIVERLKNDPLDTVRTVAPKILLQVCARRYHVLRQHTSAIEMLRQAILLDPKDHQSYNQLAWIKATCPDASIRNGDDAVSAAGKACELTEWKNWQYVDTLAAAYAEAGDFKRALEFQEQALRTGAPAESEQEVMRQRVLLYKQSHPFRGKP